MKSHQLADPVFNTPAGLVEWMGAIQAQEYTKCKWAIGVRLASGTCKDVDNALENGEIVRAHILRPTWHIVSGKDIRWMLKLTAPRIRKAYESYYKGREVDPYLFVRSNRLLEKSLNGTCLTKQELIERFEKEGIINDKLDISRFLFRAEVEGMICSGGDRSGKSTFALLEERVPAVPELTREESLARLARLYFRSHSPATLEDFTWWSGLTTTESKQAIRLIEDELITDTFAKNVCYLHNSCQRGGMRKQIVHLLPAFDEYLISYKERSTVMKPEHFPKAFNTFGIFQNVILYKGKIVGNWQKNSSSRKASCSFTFFEESGQIAETQLQKAAKRYLQFHGFAF